MRGHRPGQRCLTANTLLLPILFALLLASGPPARAEERMPAPSGDVQPPPPAQAEEDATTEPWPDLAGHWEGAITLPGTELQILLDFSRNEAGDWVGTMDSPMQSARGIPLADIVVNDDRVDFAVAGLPGNPIFKGRAMGKRIEGEFTQAGQTFPFRIGREPLTRPRRPQEPNFPFPYRIEQVTYQRGDILFAGTLTIPKQAEPCPAALLISGSGPQNRDEEIFGHKPFAVLADFLTRAGVAVLRVDDRGVGGTTGATATATSDDFADDALAGVAFLRARPDIDGTRVGLIGHSEGGLIAPLAATRSEDVAFVVMLAGTGLPGRDILLKQAELINRAEGTGKATIQAELNQMGAVLELIESGADTASIRARVDEIAASQLAAAPDSERAAIETTADSFRMQLGSMTSPWFRHFLTYDPRPALRQLRVPILAVTGGLDLQVPPDQNLPEIEKALRKGKNKDYTIKRLAGLNHLLQPARTGAVSEYAAIETTIDPSALETIRDWIVQRFVGK